MHTVPHPVPDRPQLPDPNPRYCWTKSPFPGRDDTGPPAHLEELVFESRSVGATIPGGRPGSREHRLGKGFLGALAQSR